MKANRDIAIRGSKWTSKTVLTEDYTGKLPELKQTDSGKYVMEFNSLPAIVFVSMDGHGWKDELYIHGKRSLTHSSVVITSMPGELTTYDLRTYAAMKEVSE